MNCPACGRPIQYGVPSCGGCGADLRGYWAQGQAQQPQAQAMGAPAYSQPAPALTPQAMPPPPATPPSAFKDFLVFRRMITPVILQVIFWLGLLGVLVGSFIAMSEEAIVGILGLLLGPIIWRVYCELLILLFRMNETLTDIRSELTRR